MNKRMNECSLIPSFIVGRQLPPILSQGLSFPIHSVVRMGFCVLQGPFRSFQNLVFPGF